MIRERVLKIGKPEFLASVVSIPEGFDSSKPAIIILNSGVMHHIGACRLSVKVARALAQNGSLALRFDFSGIGDSTPRSGALSFEESAPLEVIEVMNYLQKSKGIDKFILFGLCSGADAAYETALKDERVCGICQIDPYTYSTKKSLAYHWGSRIFSLSHWRLYVKYRLNKIGKGTVATVEDSLEDLPSYVREFPPREQIGSGLQKLIDRGMHLSVIFTSCQNYYYHDQFVQSMSEVNFKGLIKSHFYPGCQHIITEPHYQKKAVEDIVSWSHKVIDGATAGVQVAA